MATNLKLKKKCRIVAPDWLSAGTCATLSDQKTCLTTLLSSADFLQERLMRETTDEGFSQLPFRFAELAKVLLDVSVSFHFRFQNSF